MIEQKNLVNKTYTYDEQEFETKKHFEERYCGESFNFTTKITQVSDDKLVVDFEFTDHNGEIISKPVLILSWNELGEIALSENGIPTFELKAIATK